MAKSRAATVGGTTDDIEAAFYEAMREGDIEKLMSCWSDEDDIVCIHPGGQRLVGLASIRASFEAIFEEGSVGLTLTDVRKVETLTCAMHSVIERLEVMTEEGLQKAYVIATNVYQRTAQGWRIVAHHATPASAIEPTVVKTEKPQVLH